MEKQADKEHLDQQVFQESKVHLVQEEVLEEEE